MLGVVLEDESDEDLDVDSDDSDAVDVDASRRLLLPSASLLTVEARDPCTAPGAVPLV